MKLTALDSWPPQEWKADTQTLAPENARRDRCEHFNCVWSIPISWRLRLSIIGELEIESEVLSEGAVLREDQSLGRAVQEDL